MSEQTCTCPHIMLGSEVTEHRNWSERCAEHGVGTEYFQGLEHLPFGYAAERKTTREQWLRWLDEG
jgi:hypothetical protein